MTLKHNLALAVAVAAVASLWAVLAGGAAPPAPKALWSASPATAPQAEHDHAATGGVVHSREFFRFDDLDSMVATSSAVVEGTIREVGPSRSVGEGHEREDYEAATLEVTAVLSGEVEGSTVAVEHRAAIAGNPVVVNGVTGSRAGDSGFYFLRRTRRGVYDLISSQGRFLRDGGRLRGSGQHHDPLTRSLEARDEGSLREEIRGAGRRAAAGNAKPHPYPPGLDRVPVEKG